MTEAEFRRQCLRELAKYRRSKRQTQATPVHIHLAKYRDARQRVAIPFGSGTKQDVRAMRETLEAIRAETRPEWAIVLTDAVTRNVRDATQAPGDALVVYGYLPSGSVLVGVWPYRGAYERIRGEPFEWGALPPSAPWTPSSKGFKKFQRIIKTSGALAEIRRPSMH